ncbi:MAG: respiratory nitrate reductase subunit gamma [Desulfobacteraceae bacterium]|nr:MAG: respiratory nitrate reductase subunit gamma [Desulfobacteraceae bacterium]
MDAVHLLAFAVYPYIVITVFVLGHAYRYATDHYGWTARSSEILDKGGLKVGITLFHWGILLTLFGHAGGMLIPQSIYDLAGVGSELHIRIALGGGLVIGLAAFLGMFLLLKRRFSHHRVRATTTVNQFVTLILLFIAIGTGLYNVLMGHYNVLDSVAPWIRSIVVLRPEPALMLPVPFSYKLHVISGLAILGFSPFTRLVHIWSVPLTYLIRRFIVFRRYC